MADRGSGRIDLFRHRQSVARENFSQEKLKSTTQRSDTIIRTVRKVRRNFLAGGVNRWCVGRRRTFDTAIGAPVPVG